jgi:hypothetical protein
VAISVVDHDRGPEIVNKGPLEPNKVLLSINRLQLSGDIVASRVLPRIAKSGTCCTCNGGSMYGGKGERIDLIRLKKLNWDQKTLILRKYANCHIACGGDSWSVTATNIMMV